MRVLSVLGVDGVGEVGPGADLAALLRAALGPDGLHDGDVLVVTSKVVSKAEARSARGGKGAHLEAETDRVLAARGDTRIVRTHHGLVLAGAGIDASNTTAGTVLLLPRDPDASAQSLREALREDPGRNVAVVLSDTAGRAWRNGQTDIAIGAAGLDVLHDYAGRVDGYGNELAVTAPAVADEIAAAGDLVKAKLARRPAAVLRGLAHLVLPPGEHGTGAAALVRDESTDMFGLGAREAVLHAVAADREALRGFGRAAPVADVMEALARAGARAVVEDGTVVVALPDEPRAAGRLEARAEAAAFACGWLRDARGASSAARARFRPASP